MFFELRRKTIHAFLALLFAFSAPFVTYNTLISASIALFVFFIFARLLGISARIGTVPRKTYGELFFALGILGALILSFPDVLLFQLAVVILAVADPLSALFGTAYGRQVFQILGEKRSVEGSVACFVSAGMILILFSVPLLVSVTVAFMLTLIEAFSPRGSDNFFLPLSTIVMLQFLR